MDEQILKQILEEIAIRMGCKVGEAIREVINIEITASKAKIEALERVLSPSNLNNPL